MMSCVFERMGAPFLGPLCFSGFARTVQHISLFPDTLALLQSSVRCFAALLTSRCQKKSKRSVCGVRSNHVSGKLTVLIFFLFAP